MFRFGTVVAALLLLVPPSFAGILIAWDGGAATNTAVQADGVGGTLFTGNLYSVDGAVGSTDGSFGGSFTGADTAATAYHVRTVSPGNNDTVGIQIRNNTGEDLHLCMISFDYLAWFANSPKTITLTYAYGDLADADGTILKTVGGLGDGGGRLSDYPDYDWTLENLSDTVLADGESATFELVATDAASETTGGGFDNIAISGDRESSVSVAVDTGAEEHAVTKMAMGTGLVYSWYADSMFADGEAAHIIKDVGLGALRWPGGATTTFYHWNNLNGRGWLDSWNPSYDHGKDQPPEAYMDLDEYFALIDQTGAEIMLGVNMSSGKEWNREAEGIAEASNLMAYCQSQGYDVEYVFFDNENFQPGNNYNNDDDGDGECWNPTNYAESFNLYAAAVKATFPDAKLIANARNNVTGSAFLSDMQTMLSIAGTNIDLVDLHYYWQWNTASWSLWKSQLPMKRNGSQSYKDTIEYANNLFANEGYPDVRAAVLEWNIGPGPWTADPWHNKFKTALMQVEMQMQFLQAGLDIGMLYTLESTRIDPAEDKHVMHNGDPNATALWMWLFSRAVGKTVVQSSASVPGIYSVAAKGSQGELVVYLLNKTDLDQTVELDIPGYAVNEVSEAWRFHDAGNGKGSLTPIGLWENNGNQRTTLQANSLNMIGFNYLSNNVPSRTTVKATLAQPIADGMLLGWDSASGAAGVSVPGVSGELFESNLYAVDDAAGSTDGTYGSIRSGAATELGAFVVRGTNSMDTLGFSVVNQSGVPLRLDSVHFDYSAWWKTSPKTVALVYASGDLEGVTNQTPVQAVSGLPNTGKTGNYPDFDWSLASLGDRVLGHGESANFRLVASNAATGWASGAFDNLAVYGGTVTDAVDSVLVSWRAQTGKKYAIMQSTNLLSNAWNPASGTLVGQPGDMSASVPLRLPGFYRLEGRP